MDRMIYLSMTGAKALMERQDALSHNLANASTDGFRADLMTARAVPIRSEGTATTRVFNVETSTGFDGKSGPIRQTGNPLDLAIRDNGWFAVRRCWVMAVRSRCRPVPTCRWPMTAP